MSIKESVINATVNSNGTISAKMTSHNINFMYVAIVLALSFITMVFVFAEEDERVVCQRDFLKASNDVAEYNKANPKYPIPEPKYDCGTANLTPSSEEPPKVTLRQRFGLEDCRFINDTHRMGKYNLDWIAYDIACVPGQPFDVKSPGDYVIEKIGYGTSLGNYVILLKDNTRIVLGHLATSRKEGTKLSKGDIIGQTNISGESTGIHVHIELWHGFTNVSREFALGEKYKSYNGTALLNHRKWDFGQQKENVYYFTSYDLGDINQNDAAPCIGASGKDLCQMERSGVRTMALTSDIRQKMGINFGDKVRLLGDEGCEGVFQVEDEMNKRFREVPGILRPNTPYYIKGDLPSKEGGVCSVTKI